MVIMLNHIIAILWNESELFLNIKQTSGDAPAMRLTENQIKSIRQAVKENFGSGTQVWLSDLAWMTANGAVISISSSAQNQKAWMTCCAKNSPAWPTRASFG
jgi:hypothetical protein